MEKPTPSFKALYAVALLVVVMAGGLYAYQFVYLPQASPPLEPPTLREIELEARQWEFEPKEIVVNEGDTVILKIRSSLDVEPNFDKHGFIILGIDGTAAVLPRGEVVEVQFVAEQPGRFTYLCTIFCGVGHTEMKGTLIVRER